MPKRKRSKEQGPVRINSAAAAAAPAAPVVLDEATRAARLFAESVRTHEAADRAAQQRAADALDRERLHARLRDDKQAAADAIKRLRASGAHRQRVVEAEAAYRAALADLQEFETGERPHWAPAKPVDELEEVESVASPEEAPVDGDPAEPSE